MNSRASRAAVGTPTDARRAPTRRELCTAFALAGLLPAGGLAQAPAVAPAFLSIDFDWHDEARGRPVPARLHLPAADGGPVPLVVFSHGMGGSREGYSYLGRYWASNGIASLHVQHVGSDRYIWTGDIRQVPERLRAAFTDGEVLARVHDLRFALDQLLAGGHASRIDARRIAAGGHSYGANTALLVAGAQVHRNGRPLDLRDARVGAVIVISAPPFYDNVPTETALAGIMLPSLHVTSTEDDIYIPGFYSGLDDRLAVFDAIGGRPKALAVFRGGSHSMFTDRKTPGGATLNPLVKEATRDLSLAFLDRVFRSDREPLQRWPARHVGLLERFQWLDE